jgi:two-component system, cell cycle response regulator
MEIIRPQPPIENANAPAATRIPIEPLGDTDLVEAILAADGSIRALALRLMIQQTGWDDATLTELPPAAKPSPRSASILATFRGYDFGHLNAIAPAAQLQPWADWLARWLALDAAHQGHRLMSLKDELTGSWNRRFFERFLSDAIARAAPARRPVTIMVFDIDNFKTFNDRFGHEAGDEILRQTVALLNSVIRQGDRVCRIGGDEFVVVFADSEAPRKPGPAAALPETVDVIARRFQDQICRMNFPKLGIEAPGNLSISAGLATYPWDGSDAASLLRHADQLALESKRKGKNAITLGPGTQQACRRDG